METTDSDLMSSMHSGLKDIGRHVVLGFTKLTGLELPAKEDVHYYMGGGDKRHYQGQQQEGQEVYGNHLENNLVGGEQEYYYKEEPSVRTKICFFFR